MKLQELNQNELTEINGGALLSSNLLDGTGLSLSSLTSGLSGLGLGSLGSGTGLSGLTGLLSGLTGSNGLSVTISTGGHSIGLSLGTLLS